MSLMKKFPRFQTLLGTPVGILSCTIRSARNTSPQTFRGLQSRTFQKYGYFQHENPVSENPYDVRLVENGFDPEDVPPVLDLLVRAPRITTRNSGIRHHLNAMGVTAHAHALEHDFQKGSPPAESSEVENFQEGSPPDGCPEISENKRFPTERRVERLPLSTDSQEIIDKWFETSQITLGPVIPDTESRNKVKRLLYTYRELNATELSQIPPTDLYEHKVRLAPGTKPWNVKSQKRWPPNQKFWLDKTIQEGMDCGFFEKTVVANGELSDWNAQAILVEKEDTKVTNEYRVTFNYRNVKESLPGCYVTLLSEAHDYLSNPSHQCFFQCDVKHAYWAVSIYPPHRHYFAFSIAGHGQLQPTRMPQGSITAAFSMTELMYIALGAIPRSERGISEGYDDSEPSLLMASSPNGLPRSVFYMDDIFAGCKTFQEGYDYLEQHLLPRLLWSQLKLSFKKLKLFMDRIVALGIVHKAGGVLQVKPDRSEKIRKFPVPREPTDIRKFTGAVGITRRWIKNFSELCRPLSRLTGDVEWKWGHAEQVAFETIREKAAAVVDMHGWDFRLAVDMYTDASLYAAGCMITQRQNRVQVPILFDSFTFTKPQRNYGVYKRELLAIVEFSRKHEHMLRGPETNTVHTDHKPITFFLQCSHLEGIYARWACELRDLNIDIVYIPGEKNKAADALSRTIFLDEECNDDLSAYGSLGFGESGEPRWIWKDGKGGYETLLKDRKEPLTDSELRQVMGIPPEILAGTDHADQVFLTSLCCEMAKAGYVLEVDQENVARNVHDSHLSSQMEKYHKSAWYGDILRYVTEGILPKGLGVVQKKAFLRDCFPYRWKDGKLWHEKKGILRLCITENEVADVLYHAHDKSGHFAAAITIRRLKEYFWPRIPVDVSDYIAGCLPCAKHSTAQRSQKLNPVRVNGPMQMWGIDFVGPFPQFPGVVWRYVLVIVDYFSRFCWAYLCVTDDQQEVIEALTDLFEKAGRPIGFYADPGPHFGEETQTFVRQRGMIWSTSPVAAKNATGMVEKTNDLLQRILKKSGDPQLFHLRLKNSVQELNRHEIVHLGFSPQEIHYGYQPEGSLERSFPGSHHTALSVALQTEEDCVPIGEEWENLVLHHIARSMRIREKVREVSGSRKDREKQKYDKGIHEHQFTPGQLVMLYDSKAAGKKLRPAWRGPFVVTGFAGDHQKSYTLRQICGTPISRTFHGDHLERLRLREGYLVSGREQELPVIKIFVMEQVPIVCPEISARFLERILLINFEYS